MLVRANSILLLWNPFLYHQPINSVENPSRLDDDSDNTHQQQQIDDDDDSEQIITPDNNTARSVNNSIKNNGYGSVTIENTNTTINVSLQEIEESNRSFLSQHQQHNNINNLVSSTISLSEEEREDKYKSDAIDRFSEAPDTKLHTTTTAQHQQQDSSISVKDIYHSPLFDVTTTTTLLDHSIPTYFKTALSSNYSIPTKTTTDDNNVIYYKRREDFYPQILKQEKMQSDEESLLTPASNNSQQNSRRQSIHNVLGKAATRIHPGNNFSNLHNDSGGGGGGMPVFKQASTTVADKIKPKTIFKRLKTLVKNKKQQNQRSTLS